MHHAVLRRLFVPLLAMSLAACPLKSPSPQTAATDGTAIDFRFKDVTVAAGITFAHTWGADRLRNILDSTGGGGGFFDYDNDGDQDIYLVQGGGYAPDGSVPPDKTQTSALYRNNDDGSFTDVTQAAGVGNRGFGMGVYAADYDNDGDQDLFVTNYGENILYRNNGDGTFTDVTKQAHLDQPTGWGSSAAWGDVDNDGRLDLYVARYIEFNPQMKNVQSSAMSKREGFMFFPGPRDYNPVDDTLYHNNGDGTFSDISREAGLSSGGKGLGVVFADFDDDGDQDIFVANDRVPNFLYVNDGKGHFTDKAFDANVAVSEDGEETASMGIAVDDYDGDGRMDVVITNMIFEYNSLYHNEGGMRFTDRAKVTGFAENSYQYVGFGVAFFDPDSDGLRDIFVNNGHLVDYIDAFSQSWTTREERFLHRQHGDGHFEDITARCGDIFGVKKIGRGVALADFDNDGDMDLLAMNAGESPNLYRNDGGNKNHWLRVKAIGTKSNRDGIGARVSVTTGGHTHAQDVRLQAGYLGSNDPRLLFGLGDTTGADSVVVHWPSGQVDNLGAIEANQMITVVEGRGLDNAAKKTKN